MDQFFEEIMEQPLALERTLKYYENAEGKTVLYNIKEVLQKESFEQIIFTGMGSSYFTSFASHNMFSSVGIVSCVVNASELLHYNLSILDKKTLLVCISQSGESFEVVEILKKLPKSVTTVGITNDKDSTLAKKADITLFSRAGNENMTSTKTYVSITLVSYILALYLSDNWNSNKINNIKNLIENFKVALTDFDTEINNAIEFLGELPALQIIARGASFSTASQSALMFKEANRIAATGILGGEFRHGPIEMVQKGFKSILFAPYGKTISQSLKMAKDIAKLGGKVLLITNVKVDFSNKNIMVISIKEQDEFLFSMQSIIPIQLFIDSFAKKNGYEAGSFAHGAKVTVVE